MLFSPSFCGTVPDTAAVVAHCNGPNFEPRRATRSH